MGNGYLNNDPTKNAGTQYGFDGSQAKAIGPGPSNPIIQMLVQQFGLSAAQAQAYVDTLNHPSHDVVSGNVIDAAKARLMRGDYILSGQKEQNEAKVSRGNLSLGGEVQMPPASARPVNELGNDMFSGIMQAAPLGATAQTPDPTDNFHKRQLMALSALSTRGARMGANTPPSLDVGDVSVQDMPLDIGDVSVAPYQPVGIGDVTVKSRRR